MKKALKSVLGDPQKKSLNRLKKRISGINDLEDGISKLSDDELKAKTDEFRKKLKDGKSLDDILPEAFAVVREAAKRVLDMRPYDVQLIGGMAMHDGSVVEMRTGEGKTLVATLPIYLNALEGKGVHLVTVNDYLAQRDAGWMGELYNWLGLSVSVIIAENTYIYDEEYENNDHDDERFKHLKPTDRRSGYEADITYGTNNEFGFDYLRDNMVRETDQLRQRELNFAIVDEVDSILIDEARTPLIISAPASASGSSYGTFASVVRKLGEDDYEKDEKRKTVVLNDDGVAKVQDYLGVDNLYAPDNVRMIYHLEQALRAEVLFTRDKDYIVSDDNEVIIVDEFTGRLMHGRRYNEGLHQAIEAKEGVEVLQESMTLATISFQNYFRLYDKLSGMTGTAETESEEFFQIYKLDVVVVPTNKPTQRDDKPDRIYKSQAGKHKAIVSFVKELHEKGQPVLIGTSSIENNEMLSRMLSQAGLDHNVLNAKAHESEAAIVAKAGRKGAITLATNIAGRGTDIKLEEGVTDLGGLFVLGSERHESRRIDNQLRGRSGRQGDPGETQFFVAADDDLMRIFGGDRIGSMMERLGVDEDIPIENRTISKALENAQKKVEGHNFDIRKQVVQYDDVMNRHRKKTYSRRKSILTSESVKDDIEEMINVEANNYAPQEGEKKSDLVKEVANVFNFDEKESNAIAKASDEKFVNSLAEAALKNYSDQETAFGEDQFRKVEREVYLQVVDNLWMQHLENMDHLREGINWRSVGQRDPLVEYRKEGQKLFEEMEANLQTDTIRGLLYAMPTIDESLEEPIETELTKAAAQSVASGSSGNVLTAGTTGTGSSEKAEAKASVKGKTEEELKAEKRRKRQAQKKKKQKRKKSRR